MWRSEARGRTGKPTKIPYCPRQPERRADTTDPTTWARRDEAEDAARRCLNGAGGGVGIVLGDLGTDHYLAGLDLDGSVDDGGVTDWAAALLEVIPSYAELSPSLTGIKVFFRLRAAAVRPLLDRLEASGWGLKRGIPGFRAPLTAPASSSIPRRASSPSPASTGGDRPPASHCSARRPSTRWSA